MARTEIGNDQILDGTIVNLDINSGAAIAGTKISPNFGTQNLIVDTNLLYVDSAALRVGIGTVPSAKFHVAGGDILLENTYSLRSGLVEGASLIGRGSGAGALISIGSGQAGDTLAMFAGGAERIRVDTSGHVGIGTTSPGERFQVTGGRIYPAGTGTGTGITFDQGQMYLSSSGNHIVLAPQGNVGINTASPSEALEVLGNIRITGGGNGTGNLPVDKTLVIGTGGHSVNFLNNDGAGVSGIIGSWNTVYNSQDARVIFGNDGGGHSAYIAFNVSNTGSVDFEAARISSSGFLGIGTASPAYKLSIGDGTTAGDQVASVNVPSVNVAAFDLSKAGATKARIQVLGGTDNLTLDVGGSARMTILGSNGRVGIGSASPNEALYVVGSVQVGEDNRGFFMPNAQGIYQRGTADLHVESNTAIIIKSDAAEAARFTGGKLGIGVTAPGARLHVKMSGDGPTGGLRLEPSTSVNHWNIHNANGATEDFGISRNNSATPFLTILAASGHVGIGTAAPSGMLHIKTASADQNLHVTELSGILSVSARNTADNGYVRLNIEGAPLVINSNSTDAVGIGASPATWSVLDVTSTTKGFLGPRMTTAQRTTLAGNLGAGDKGMEVYDTDLLAKYVWNGTLFVAVGSGGGHTIQEEGSSLTQRTKLDFQGLGVTATDGGAGPDSTIVTIGGNTEIRQGFVATGGQTVFTLSTPYTLGANNLKVFRNGALMTSGAGNDYTETSTTSFTMLNAQTAGDVVTAVYLTPSTNILQSAAGVEYRQSFTSTGSPQTFTLSNAYLNNGTNLRVFVNGALQKPSTNYSEDNTTQFTFTTGLTAGDNVEAVWVGAATGVVSFTPATEVRQNFVATGSEAGLFALTGGATFTQGGANLKVYVDGVLNVLGGAADYTEPSNSQVQFNSGNHPTAGQVVSLVAITQVGALGSFQNRRDEFVATSGQTVFSASFTFVMGGADMLVYNDGVLMKLGEDYYELNNSQVVFYVGRTLNSKVTLVSKIQAAAGDANSVNGISASITPTANKLVPLDGSGLLPSSVLPTGVWQVVATVAPSAASTSSFTGLTGNTSYRLRTNLVQNTSIGRTYIQFNGDAGGNYEMWGAAIVSGGHASYGSSSLTAGFLTDTNGHTANTPLMSVFEFVVGRLADNSKAHGFYMTVDNRGSNGQYQNCQGSINYKGAAVPTTMTFGTTAGTYTGFIYLEKLVV